MHALKTEQEEVKNSPQKRQIRPRRNHTGVLRRCLKAAHKNHRVNMARKAEVRALAAAVEGTNAVALTAQALVPPPPSPPCPPRHRIADTMVRAMRSSPPVFVLASPASPPSSSKLRPPVHVSGERFTLTARHGARPFYGSWVEFTTATAAGPAIEAETTSMTAHFPKADDVWIITEDTSSEESSPS
uniref:Uncharacterized protein n=1 Tax=Leersia perrieri TaxID=77586 RepID=A0A0D9V7N6_9ORYZ